jgi:hypothetical protein
MNWHRRHGNRSWMPYNRPISKRPMTATFADYAAQQDARNTIQLNIVKYGLMLCDALTQVAPDGYGYELDSSGRKYHKIIYVHHWSS